MSIQSFVPSLWSGKILSHLRDDHIYAQCFNRDYEGEIKEMGSSVKINSVGRPTVRTYTRNTDIDTPEEIDMTGQWLVVDQGSYYNWGVDNVDKKQAKSGFLDEFATEASWAMADVIDEYLAGVLQAGAGLTATAATIGVGAGESSLYDILVAMKVALDETNTPKNDRWAIVPPFAEGLIMLDERFSGFGTAESRTVLRGAPIARAAGFDIRVSNNVPRDSSEYSILAGYKGAATFAEQLVETTAYKPERRFGDAVKSLHVYGSKVTRPSNIIRFDATRGSLTS